MKGPASPTTVPAHLPAIPEKIMELQREAPIDVATRDEPAAFILD
ncbi:MAG: hypothetical protein OXI57_07830 [Rhodospirillales bacterium]|nr:hypothetical protein [Rhodospirillales bacterium]